MDHDGSLAAPAAQLADPSKRPGSPDAFTSPVTAATIAASDPGMQDEPVTEIPGKVAASTSKAKSRPPRSSLWLGLAGFLAGTTIVLGGGQVGPVTGTTFPSSWLGTLARNHVVPSHTPLPGSILVGGIALLVAVWLVTLRVATRQGWQLRWICTTVAGWAAPLALGPPLLSGDVYSYAAQGMLANNGGSPYTSTPAQLTATMTAAVDPSWRGAHSPYGPLTTAIEHLSVLAGGGTMVGAAVVLRLLGVVSVLALGYAATTLTTPRRGPIVLMLTAANPLVLLHFISGAHIDGPMVALVALALLAERRGHPGTALALGCAAGMVKAPGFVVVLVILVTLWHNHRVDRAAAMTRSLMITAASLAILTLLVPHGWGWVSSWNTPGQGNTPGAPAALLGSMFHPLIGVASYDDLMAGGRITMLCIGGAAITWFLHTSRQRPVTATTGWGLLVFSVINPVLYPWYLTWGICCLAIDARRPRRDWLIALSVWGTTLNVPGVVGWMAAPVFGATDLAILCWLIWAVTGRPPLRGPLRAISWSSIRGALRASMKGA